MLHAQMWLTLKHALLFSYIHLRCFDTAALLASCIKSLVQSPELFLESYRRHAVNFVESENCSAVMALLWVWLLPLRRMFIGAWLFGTLNGNSSKLAKTMLKMFVRVLYVSFGQGSSLLWTHTLRPLKQAHCANPGGEESG